MSNKSKLILRKKSKPIHWRDAVDKMSTITFHFENGTTRSRPFSQIHRGVRNKKSQRPIGCSIEIVEGEFSFEEFRNRMINEIMVCMKMCTPISAIDIKKLPNVS